MAQFARARSLPARRAIKVLADRGVDLPAREIGTGAPGHAFRAYVIRRGRGGVDEEDDSENSPRAREDAWAGLESRQRAEYVMGDDECRERRRRAGGKG